MYAKCSYFSISRLLLSEPQQLFERPLESDSCELEPLAKNSREQRASLFSGQSTPLIAARSGLTSNNLIIFNEGESAIELHCREVNVIMVLMLFAGSSTFYPFDEYSTRGPLLSAAEKGLRDVSGGWSGSLVGAGGEGKKNGETTASVRALCEEWPASVICDYAAGVCADRFPH
ncbi:hypothetical protein F2P81_010211 [Scophthalmus maximus]|uniref:Uncharacterized protein n=1 Tax=Scophthalmus maximus TaxID=52904 RepID=A0A6A4SV44_SCOMX|nr:hypothetical protein F2P81_010211 [Scophthalmus maximus]